MIDTRNRIEMAPILGPCTAALLVLSLMLPTLLPAQTDALRGAPSWTIYSHDCPGPSRTDALHRDADGTLWVGCGTNQLGYGLYRSLDGGASWTEVTVNPPNLLFQFRVNDINRGHDGALYAAGTNQNSFDMVLRIETTTSLPYAAEASLIGTNQVGRVFPVGTYDELSDGRALATSKTGTPQLYRPTSTTGPSAGLWTVPPSPLFQILDMTVRNDAFVGVGSTIAQTPRVFLPPQSPGALPYEFEIVELSTTWTGEMWAVAANQQRVVAAGINQIANIGTIFVSQGNPYNSANYLVHELPDIVGAGGVGTWARGACMEDDFIVVVGERQPLGSNTGLAVASNDGGQTFFNITPSPSSESLSRCEIAPNGLVIVAGAGGFIGLWDGFLPPDEIFSSRFE
jgi:hypothetical protein